MSRKLLSFPYLSVQPRRSSTLFSSKVSFRQRQTFFFLPNNSDLSEPNMLLIDFIVRCLLMVFGYAYPAFQCFKAVERNEVEIEGLRFWCQYWIILAMVTVLERITDVLLSWFPLYSEIKLAFVIYLWHPKTKGTRFIYEGVLRPFVSQHESHIDQKLMEFRSKIRHFVSIYLNNFAQFGQAAAFQLLQTMASQSGKVNGDNKGGGNGWKVDSERKGHAE